MRTFADEQAADQFIDNLITPRNRSIYDNNPLHRSIDHERIYFYYVTDTTVRPYPKPKFYIYDAPNPMRNRAEIRAKIKHCAQNASDGGNDPLLYDLGFDAVEWTKRSLIVIVIDYDGWKFKKNGAVVFEPGNGIQPNHTFFDALDYDFPIRDKSGVSKEVSSVCFENHMVDEYGYDLGIGVREYFNYWLIDRSGSRLFGQPIDPGGVNLGPPVPPPY